MDILFCFDRNYEQHFGVAVTSLLLNNPNQIQRIHLVTKDNTDSFHQKIERLEKEMNTHFLFYAPSDEAVEGLKISSHISLASYYRLLAPDLLPKELSKVLYLDSDLIVKDSLEDLYNLDISEYVLAASAGKMGPGTRKRLDLLGDYYFNAGVMLINLERWWADNIGVKCLKFVRDYPERIRQWDQDALNKITDEQFLNIDAIWNTEIDLSQPPVAGFESAKIIHYVGKLKPWQSWCFRSEKDLYWSYLKQSPWSTAWPQLPKNDKQLLSAAKAVYLRLFKGNQR